MSRSFPSFTPLVFDIGADDVEQMTLIVFVIYSAVKLRYLVQVIPPPSSTSAVQIPPQAVVFDPSTVAKQEAGWEAMLEGLVGAWIGQVAEEEREADAARNDDGEEV